MPSATESQITHSGCLSAEGVRLQRNDVIVREYGIADLWNVQSVVPENSTARHNDRK